jgi:hypothetical protein
MQAALMGLMAHPGDHDWVAAASAVIGLLLQAGADPNDVQPQPADSKLALGSGLTSNRNSRSSSSSSLSSNRAYSTALLAALQEGLEDLAMLLHLSGARLPPSCSDGSQSAR